MELEERMRELEERLRELEELKEVRAETKPDRNESGKVIGIVRYTTDSTIKCGMVVLFADHLARSLPPHIPVYLIDYAVRESKTPGKYYVKCFNAMKEEQWKAYKERMEEEKRKLEEELKNLENSLELLKKQEKMREIAELLGVPAEEFEKVAMLSKDALVTYLTACGLDVVHDFWYWILVLLNGKVVAFDVEYWKYKIASYPVEERPEKFASNKSAVVYIDDAGLEEFEAREIATALAEKGFKTFWWGEGSSRSAGVAIVMPKNSELFKKFMAVKTTSIPAPIKKLIYCEVLGLDIKKLSEVSKSAW